MSEPRSHSVYPLDSDEEPPRLERQARLYGAEDDLRHLALSLSDCVLDVGCGSGSVTRVIARAVSNVRATGGDREPTHLDLARRKAAAEGIGNIQFDGGDTLRLPFVDGRFDVVWSKHLIQFVRDRQQALAEFTRVGRPGGRVVCCDDDYFCVCHYPVDPELQADVEVFFETARRELGIDNLLGRKLPHLLLQAGLVDVRVDFIPDRVSGGFGGAPEKCKNRATQFQSVIGFSANVFGSMERAQHFTDRTGTMAHARGRRRRQRRGVITPQAHGEGPLRASACIAASLDGGQRVQEQVHPLVVQ